MLIIKFPICIFLSPDLKLGLHGDSLEIGVGLPVHSRSIGTVYTMIDFEL
jgi:hypothetical protein